VEANPSPGAQASVPTSILNTCVFPKNMHAPAMKGMLKNLMKRDESVMVAKEIPPAGAILSLADFRQRYGIC
jgi:hypothetical protein